MKWALDVLQLLQRLGTTRPLAAPSSRAFAVTQTSILPEAHALRIQELEAQVRELKARPALAPAPSPPHVSDLTGLSSASIALSAARRDETYMKEVCV